MATKNDSIFKIMMVVTVLIFAILVAFVLINNNKEDKSQEQNENEDISSGAMPSLEGQPVYGDPDAPVTIVEFGDFKCPACKFWSQAFYPQIIQDYVNSGDVKIAYIHVLFHGEESELGSLAAEAVYKQNPDAYWTFSKKLFDKQPENANHDEVWLTLDVINEVATSIEGIDLDQLHKDMKDPAVIKEVEKDNQLTEEFNIQLTPTIIINGKMLDDPMDYEIVASEIEAAIKGAK